MHHDLAATMQVLLATVASAAPEPPTPPAIAEVEAEPDANHALYFELGGNALIASINYEYRPFDALSARVGLGAYYACDELCEGFPAIPLLINGLLGTTDHRVEVGLGAVVFPELDSDRIGGTGALGYRYHPRKGGFLFRAAFTPILVFGDHGAFIPWIGVSFGQAVAFE